MAGRSITLKIRSLVTEWVRITVTRMMPLVSKLLSCSVMVVGADQLSRSRGGSFLTSRPVLSRRSHAATFLLKRDGGFGVPSE